MRTKSLLFALGSLAAIGGCSDISTRLGGHYPGCTDDSNGKVCTVSITVNRCALHDSGALTATPDVRKVEKGTWIIRWEIATPGYEFARDGIAFKSPTPPHFTNGAPNGNKFQWVDNNQNATGYYPYGIHVNKTGGAECASVDPGVSND